MIKPTQSYTIWFSQRTGSTFLYKALASTGVAGNPAEWLHYGWNDPAAFNHENLVNIWKHGTTPNGMFGIKSGYEQPWIDAFRKVFDLSAEVSSAEVWSAAFPNCSKHIYMTRRNKVRLAVSWWRAIVSDEWHRNAGTPPKDCDLADKYNYDAIHHLIQESVMFEAALEDFFTNNGIVPMTVVYEDFIVDYEGTVLKVLEYLGVPTDDVKVAPPALDKLADEYAEQWVQRYRAESQNGWTNVRW
jgi:trehalose 2-sulfotransferase